MDELKYTISEVSEMLTVSHRTLHYYESKIGINVARDGSGNRVYTDEDIDLFDKIINLKRKGLSLSGIKELFIEKGLIEKKEEEHIVGVGVDESLEMKKYFISEIRQAVSMQMKEELFDTNAKMDQIIQENTELKELISNMEIQNEKRHSDINQKITQSEEEQNQIKQPWYKRIFGK